MLIFFSLHFSFSKKKQKLVSPRPSLKHAERSLRPLPERGALAQHAAGTLEPEALAGKPVSEQDVDVFQTCRRRRVVCQVDRVGHR